MIMRRPWWFSYSFDPALTQSFGGPESFYMYQIGINANSELRLSDKDWLQGTLFFNIVNNYDKFNYKTPPHVQNLKRQAN
jgi:hypothetical protein